MRMWPCVMWQGEKMPSGNKPSATLFPIVFLLILAICWRMILSWHPRVIKWDESDYMMLGRNLFSGQGFTTAGYAEVHYPPLWPALLGMAQLVVNDLEVASEIGYIVFGALLILPLHALAWRMYGRRIALMAVALLLVLPAWAVSVLYWGTMSEPLYLLLIYSGLYALWRALEEEWRAGYAVGGLLFALAYLTRPEAILYLAVFAAWIVAWRAAQRRLRERATWLGLFAFVGVFALCALPYIIYLRQQTGRWTFSGKVGVTFDLGAAVIEKDPAAYDRATARLDDSGHHIIWFSPQRFQGSGMVETVLGDPLGFVRRVARNARLWVGAFFRQTVFPFIFLVPILLALFQTPWTVERTRRELFLLAAILPPFGFLALHIEVRFFAPLFPILLLWTAKGLDEIGLWLHGTVLAWRAESGRKPVSCALGGILRALPLACALLFLIALLPVAAQEGQQATDFSYKKVGLWLREHTPLEARIMSRDVAVAVYAERAWVPSPHAEYDAYLAYARYHGVDYVVIGEREATVLRPGLAFLLDEAHPPPELELVHVQESEHGKVLAYRLRPNP